MHIKNRIELAKYWNTLGFKKIAEIGVFDGNYSEIICQKIPGVKLYAIDCWEVYYGYRSDKFKAKMAAAEDIARKRLAQYNCEIIKKFSIDAVKDFGDEFLDAVFIDGNHEYKYVKEDIEIWTPKVRAGGCVSGHDMYIMPSGNTGVVDAVNEYIAANNYKLNVTDWDYEQENQDNRQPCWWFMK